MIYAVITIAVLAVVAYWLFCVDHEPDEGDTSPNDGDDNE